MIDVRNIPISDIDIGGRLRQIDDGQVESLKESILEIGLLNPITVYAIDENRFGLVAGAHRLEACRRIGHDEIPGSVVEFSDLERQLAECDENLCASKLTPVEEARFVARRKEVYEAIHPETKRGANLENARVDSLATREERAPRFITDTAAKTGISERAVGRHAERGSKIIDEAMALIQGTPLDKGSYLDKLKDVAPEKQVETAKQDLENHSNPRKSYGHLSGATAQVGQGGIAGRYKTADTQSRSEEDIFDRFIALVDEIESLSLADLVVGAGRKRAVLGQRASSLADRMSELMEAIA